MFSGKYCLTLFLLFAVAISNSHGEGTRDQRFILDTFYNYFVGVPAQLAASVLTVATLAECRYCKCFEACSASHFFGPGISEKDVCGHSVWDSINCTGVTMPPPTTTPVPSMLSNGTSVTQHPPPTINSCDRMCTVGSIAKSIQMSSNYSSMCFNGQHTSNEALPMVCCGLKSQSVWKTGAKVTDSCTNIDLRYSPVAAFVNGEYIPGSAGIFIACKSNGFQVAFQTCDKAPVVAAVSTHRESYYVIEQY